MSTRSIRDVFGNARGIQASHRPCDAFPERRRGNSRRGDVHPGPSTAILTVAGPTSRMNPDRNLRLMLRIAPYREIPARLSTSAAGHPACSIANACCLCANRPWESNIRRLGQILRQLTNIATPHTQIDTRNNPSQAGISQPCDAGPY